MPGKQRPFQAGWYHRDMNETPRVKQNPAAKWGAVRVRLAHFLYPPGLEKVTRSNYQNVQIDAVGIGLASAAGCSGRYCEQLGAGS